MRLVQRTMLPNSEQIHLAEVFLSGLIERVTAEDALVDPDFVDYDFCAGIRDRLLDASWFPQVLEVQTVVSDYLMRHFGQALDFQAILADPESAQSLKTVARQQAEFASITTEVLRRLGGKYAEAAERLEAERLEKERLEMERLEAERLEKERLEMERLEAERLEKERLEMERLEAERLEKERLEMERLKADHTAREMAAIRERASGILSKSRTVDHETLRQGVFICFSHRDRKWLEKPNGCSNLWCATIFPYWQILALCGVQSGARMQRGNWAAARVVVLLVSSAFLASDFIAEHELPLLLEAAERQGLVILWVYVSSCLYDETDIKDYQAAHDISKPLNSLTLSEQDQVLAEICREIRSATTDPKQIEDAAAVTIVKAADALDKDDAPAALQMCRPWLERLADLDTERAITIRTYCNVISAEARRRDGDLPLAFRHLDAARSDTGRIKDAYQYNFLLGRLWKTVGLAERDRGSLEEARKALKTSESYYEKINVASGSIDALTELATIEENANQYGAALQYYDQVERIAEREGLPGGLALARRGRATIAYYRDDIPTAISQAGDALKRFTVLEQEIGIAECEVLLGRANMVRGKWDEAVHWFEAARGRFHRLALPRREAGMVLELGHLALLRSKALAAKQYVVEADDYFAKAEYRPGRTSSFLLLGSAERQLGNLAAARDALRRARQYAEGSEDPAIFSRLGWRKVL